MNMLKMCWNWKVLAGLGAVAVAMYLVAPNAILGVLPVLLLLACPLSMVAMMWGMRGMGGTKGNQAQGATQGQLLTAPAPMPMPAAQAAAGLSRDELLAQLRAQLQQVGEQQASIARQIEQFEAAERPAPPPANGAVREAETVAGSAAGPRG